MLMPLLLLQAVTLPANAAEAGPICAAARPISAPEDADLLDLTSQVSYYAMVAADAQNDDAGFVKRITDITTSLDPVDPAKSKQIVALCEARFPLAKSTAVAKLPSNAFDRDIMCLSMVGVALGAAQGLAEDHGDDTALKRLEPVVEKFSARLADPVLAAHGITDQPQMISAMGKQMRASLKLGNTASITNACEALVK